VGTYQPTILSHNYVSTHDTIGMLPHGNIPMVPRVNIK
jgi:hypothetical protein